MAETSFRMRATLRWMKASVVGGDPANDLIVSSGGFSSVKRSMGAPIATR